MFSIRIQTRTRWALLLLTALSASLSAQNATPHAARGHRFNSDAAQKANHANLPSRRFALSYVAEKRLTALTKDELKPDPDNLATKAGVHRKLGADLDQFARWEVTPDGKYLWRLGIQSPEAAGLRFHIRGFHAGAGALWLHGGSGRETEVMGPYSGDGPFGDGEFWTDIVLSDTVVLEFQPDGAPKSVIDPPPFEIVEISHLLPQALSAGQQPRAAANCHLDATCYPDWATTGKSVGQIVFEKGGGTFVCSGTLLATQRPSGIPYFLTADHCIPDDAVAKTMQVFWMYETAACNGAPPSNKLNLPRSLGARYLTGGGMGRGDFTLVQLTSVPDTVVFSGWDTTEPEVGARLTGIHHPDGDYKRIAFGQRVPAQQGLSGTDPDYYYSVAYADGRTEGGSSGSGVFVRPGVLVGTLTWGPKQQGPNWVCQFNPEYTGYGRFSTHYPSLRQYLEGPATPGQPTPTPGDSELTSGRALQVSMPASPTATLYTRYFIRVPQGATSLQISLNVNAEAGVSVSAGEPPKVADGRVTADYFSAGTTGRETVVVNQTSTPPLRAGVYYIGLANFTVNQAATGTLVATVQTGGQGPNPPARSGQRLTSGVAANFTFAAVQNPTLMNGEQGFRIEVPQGATRLEVRLATTSANADVDLYARNGRDIGLNGSDILADHVSDSPSGDETIVITPQSSPALRPGVYYIGLGIFAQNIATAGSVTATVTSDANIPPPAAGNALTSGVPRQFNVAAVGISTLFNDSYGFTVEVPQGATRLDIRLSTNPSNVDIDLYARLGQDVVLNSGELVTDYDSSGPDGSESISITAQSNPPLRPGTYFIAFGVFTTNVPASAMVTATVTGGGGNTTPPSAGRLLTSGTPVTFFTDAQTRETLLNGRLSYMIQVPQDATRLEIKLNTRPADFDMDLFARAGADPVLDNARVVADHSSTGPDGTETIVITAASNPPLRAGTYYIALGVWTTDRPASGTILATVTTAGSGATSTALRSGVPASFSFPAVDGATLKTGGNGFYIDVPTGTTRLDVRLNTTTAGADLDLFVRLGQDVGVENGKLVADFGSDGPAGSEAITITATSTPPLRPGRYYVGIVIYTTGVPVSGTVTATATNILGVPSGFVPLEVEPGTSVVLTPSAITRSQTHWRALLSRPALSKGRGFKKLISLTSREP